MKKSLTAMLVGGLLMGTVPFVQADESLRAEVEALRAQVAALESQQNDTWLTERRAEEVKGLIHEVLSDADTRASLMQDGIYAGHDGRHFFLASAEGDFRMSIFGQFQMRFLTDIQNEGARPGGPGESREVVHGFQMSRVRLGFKGHVADPRFGYYLLITNDVEDGSLYFKDAYISYQLTDEIKVAAGVKKLPFMREELTDATSLLAVERSFVNAVFTAGRSEQIAVSYQADMFRVAVAISDGSQFMPSGFTELGADGVDFALSGRADVKISGEWDQMKDTTAWSGEDLAIFVGGGFHWELGDSRGLFVSSSVDTLSWTVDGSVETNGIGLFAALTGSYIDPQGPAGSIHPLGVVLQGSYNINDQIEPFVRWEWIDWDTPGARDFQAVTFGLNYYLNRHNAKITGDVVWVYDGDDPFGAFGFLPTHGVSNFASANDKDLVLLRAQFQLLF